MKSWCYTRGMKRTCHYCPADFDLRPYGPNGAYVCFPCAMATPEREQEAEEQFNKILDNIKDPVLLDPDLGPVPYSGIFTSKIQ